LAYANNGIQKMARPVKSRKICCLPDCTIFKPAGIPRFELEEITLTIDEFETIRLSDLEGLYQEEAAREMGISRQTFGNIIKSARQKIASGLVNGMAIKIDGGNFQMTGTRILNCRKCFHEWKMVPDDGKSARCPKCHSRHIQKTTQLSKKISENHNTKNEKGVKN
jgi:predicted DNA-binding protein (UPF0251 family)